MTIEPRLFESFSALQRAEIAEMLLRQRGSAARAGFSALQRAEIAEIRSSSRIVDLLAQRFSALQRAEIAEIVDEHAQRRRSR